MPGEKSRLAFEAAKRAMPGGVNSPVRAFGAVGGTPVFFQSGAGAMLRDVDGKEYVDFVGSWGPLILGHAAPAVVEAVCEAARRGMTFGAPTEQETRLVEMLKEAMPAIEKARLVSSGTEAVMSALRLARGVTGRDLIVKCDGCYHGHVDGLLAHAGSGLATFGRSSSPGSPEALAALTGVVPFNDVASLKTFFDEHGRDVAALILEPVAGNMGVAPPDEDFLAAARRLTRENGALLIVDEVITGFRVAWGGAQARYGLEPDLVTLGKIVGGGLPIGVYGGLARHMDHMAPEGPVYQAGTLSGNPLATAAGIATLEALRAPGTYERLESLGQALEKALLDAAKGAGVALRVNRVGSMLTPFFTDREVTDFATARAASVKRYAAFFHGLLKRGVYAPPSQFEAWFVSLAHTPAHIEAAGRAAAEAMKEVGE
ncbi:MAG TPA: glutamate-1-semialdehyde 2,1-aminomutase [Candidatus Brocadiia bacterium]|nr:glutamate-1-semialdehyde 2,1-aminomutase [Candidatus Brocadiia bacterium]